VRETLTSAPSGDNKVAVNLTWPLKRSADLVGDILLGGLHMVHERNTLVTCGPIMAQGGIQAMETMLFTIDYINHKTSWWIKNVTLGKIQLFSPISVITDFFPM
jgi:hypothetical protein